MKTLITRVSLALFILMLLAAGTASAAKSYSADRFDVDIAVESSGALQVAETVDFRFAGGPFTYVFRELPTALTDGITDIQASLDGTPLPQGTKAGQVEITGTDPIRIRWHFPPTSDSVHTFELTYRALGVVRQEPGADALDWQALPSSYEYPIAHSAINVTWNGTHARLLGAPQVSQGSASIESGASQATFTMHDIKPGSPLTLALQFERGSLINAPPQWQARAAADTARQQQTAASQAQFAPFFILFSILVFVGGAFLLLLYWNPYQRESVFIINGAFHPNRPPDDLPPAIAGAINGSGPAWSNALATLFDLAQRGVIQVDEIPGRGWLHPRDFELTLRSQPDDLRLHERGLLALLFGTNNAKQSHVRLSKLSQNLQGQWGKFGDALKQELQDLGLYDPVRQKARRQLNVLSGTLLLLGGAFFIASLLLISALGPLFVLISLAIVGVSIVGFVLALALSPLSQEGARRAAQWQDFYKYLRYIVSGKESILSGDLFELYLPFAASYGMAEEWAKFFKKHNGAGIPSWFHALASANSSDDDGMGAFVAMMAATSAAGGGDGGAAGAGAAAAGGGASGAG